ncbi:alanyl-tRNA editing protein [Motiliproteus coralliicola]|uniref:Alanine--tRNA ligase n=1 Tax=Motiliproteus coralliicola TaxID=2283196 RepID=A0A369WMJ1_9GAMM|nr:alanyl-tRNA editing protein [Motiliproteus coralliicola]RDE22932.1 alanyl-tRNA editing protein [Motiliproteus coralliicola]
MTTAPLTQELFREDGYLQHCEATVVEHRDDGFVTDQTVFYPVGGGQLGDSGHLKRADGSEITISNTLKERDSGAIVHQTDASALPTIGERISLQIDWDRRYRIMRLHSCMHMLCAVVPAAVTGGGIRDDGSARIDFNLPEPPDKLAIEADLNRLTQGDHPMSIHWISDEEMEARPELIRTMSVKPPMGHGRVRLIQFDGADLQPCGGTHVANSGEIGPVRIKKIENKGKQNRRIIVILDE